MNPVQDFIDIRNASQINFAVSTSAAQSAAVETGGIYDVTSTVDCFIKTALVANDVAVGTGYPLTANNTVPLRLDLGMKLGAITASGSGTLRMHRVAGGNNSL